MSASTNAAIYVRISEDREGAGLGVERQTSDCHDLATRLGWNVVTVHTDNDVSAYTGKPRPGYRALLADIEAGTVDGVLVWHTDRLHRNPSELEDYVTLCERHTVVTQTVKAGPLDLASPSGRLVARQLGAVARYEVEHAVERIEAAKLQAAKAGRWGGGRRPFGYESDGVTVNPDEAQELRWATDQTLAGMSMRAIARDWNTRAVRTSTGSEWTGTEVRRLLLRARNAGLRQHRGDVIGTAEWEPIVDEDRWRAVRAILNAPDRRTNPSDGARSSLGTGLFLCGICNDGTTVWITSSRKRRSYACSKVAHLSRIEEYVDELVVGHVLERLRRPDAADLTRPTTADTTALHTDVEATRARLDELARLYADDDIDARQFAEASGRLRERLAGLDAQIATIHVESALNVFDERDPSDVWDDLDLDRRRAVIDTLVQVTILETPNGRPPGWKPGDPYFRPDRIRIDWKGQP